MALIATFGLTCYQAAKIQDIPYTNAKVIYRAYKLKKDPALRALGNLLDDDTADEPTKELQRSIWLGCLRELTERMTSNFFTERQLAKLYQCNFDLFVKSLRQFLEYLVCSLLGILLYIMRHLRELA